jgi:hypothetical protein
MTDRRLRENRDISICQHVSDKVILSSCLSIAISHRKHKELKVVMVSEVAKYVTRDRRGETRASGKTALDIASRWL